MIKNLNNKGFTLVELIVSFVMITILSITILKTTIDVQKKQNVSVAYNSYITFQSIINNAIQDDFTNNFIEVIELCGLNCYNIKYKSGDIKELSIDIEKKIITYGSFKERLPANFSFYTNISIDSKDYSNTLGYNSMIIIRIPVKSTIISRNIDIIYIYQFNKEDNPITSSI